MKHLVFFILFLFAVMSPTYATQEMRDMSLSVEQTLHEPDNTAKIKSTTHTTTTPNNNSSFDENTALSPESSKQVHELRDHEQENDGRKPTDDHSSSGFMGNFCNANYTPKTAANSAMQACQESQRQQSCERFRHTTIDIQHLLDRAINCEYIAGSGEKIAADCDGLDAGRLDLLKQYWQDEEASYTILFLPDMVLNSATNCAATTGRRTPPPQTPANANGAH